ncbi:MAG: hypothetical protein ACR2OU_11425 [Thermomicrobiales bacterium]
MHPHPIGKLLLTKRGGVFDEHAAFLLLITYQIGFHTEYLSATNPPAAASVMVIGARGSLNAHLLPLRVHVFLYTGTSSGISSNTESG